MTSLKERVGDRYHRTSQSQAPRTTSPGAIQHEEQPTRRTHSTTWEDSTPTRVLKRGPLTESNLRAHSESSMPPRRKEAAAASSFASSFSSISTTTDKGFGILLNQNNIFYGRVKTVKPTDFESVQEYLNRPRESKSPDEIDYKEYVEQVEYAENEQSMQCNTWPLLAKRLGHTLGYTSNYKYQWTEVESPLTYRISDAKPDISESFRTDQYPLKAREALSSALAPTQYRGAMPTFCAEWKGPDGILPSAEKQCAYDGALMVDAAHEAHKYMKKPSTEFFNKTQAITVALNGEFVQQYSNHMVKRGRSVEYHQYPLRTNQPRESLKDFKETYRRVRNCQDWARERAARTKDDLHAYVNAEPEVAELPWIWSVEHSRYYRTLSDGSRQWASLAPSDPAITPPSTTASFDQGLGVPTRRGKGKKVLH
jgi:hypothetical protein